MSDPKFCKTHDILNRFLYGKAGQDFFVDSAEHISAENTAMLRYVSTATCFMMCVMLILSAAVEMLFPLRSFYFISVIIYLFFAVFSSKLSPRRRRLSLVMFYLFAIVSDGAALYLGVVNAPSSASGIFFMVMLIVSVLVIDKPWRVVLYTLCTVFAFIISVMYFKADYPSIIQVDIINSVAAFIMTAFFTYFMVGTRSENMRTLRVYRFRSETDALTGLTNKATSEQLCKVYLDQNKDCLCAMLIIDVDDFKHINDCYGHEVGDEVLHKLGTVLHGTFREGDIVGRFGGDEFIILMKNIASPANAEKKAYEILMKMVGICSAVNDPLSCSIGISVGTGADKDFKMLFFEADRALYQSKADGKKRLTFFDKAFGEENFKPYMLIVDDDEFSRAILRNCFEDEYAIIWAEDGEQAMDCIRVYKSKLSIVLLDMQMPIMDGFHVLSALREEEGINFPIVVISSYEDKSEKALALGANDFIVKPFDLKTLRSRVGAVTELRK